MQPATLAAAVCLAVIAIAVIAAWRGRHARDSRDTLGLIWEYDRAEGVRYWTRNRRQ